LYENLQSFIKNDRLIEKNVRQYKENPKPMTKQMTTTLFDVLQREKSIGTIIFHDTDATTCVMASKTCTFLHQITKEIVDKHFIEFSKIMIPRKFERLAECKMFAHFKHPRNNMQYKSVQEYQNDIQELSTLINQHNYDAILDSMKASYYDYEFECNSSRGAESNMFAFMQKEYETFIIEHLHAGLTD
jgi:hypothetical protein